MRLLAVILLLLGLGACASTDVRPMLQFGKSAEGEARGMVFPPQQSEEVPRFVYVGQLTGEENFVWPDTSEVSFGSVLRWIVGLMEAEPESLRRPQAGVLDEDGRIIVTDVSRQAVIVFDQNKGRMIFWDKAAGYQSFVSPVGIALGPHGDAFVADADLGYVVRLDRDGNNRGVIGKGHLQRPTGVAWDERRQRLYVVDTHGHDIKVFDSAGVLVGNFGERGEGNGEFNFPTFVALRDDELFVSDTMNARVQVISAEDGDHRRTIGGRGMYVGNLVRPKGVAVDGEGNVYVVESYYDHLLVFNRKGQFLMAVGGGAGTAVGQYFLPSGVWIDVRNRVFLADTFNGRIVVFQFLGGGAENE